MVTSMRSHRPGLTCCSVPNTPIMTVSRSASMAVSGPVMMLPWSWMVIRVPMWARDSSVMGLMLRSSSWFWWWFRRGIGGWCSGGGRELGPTGARGHSSSLTLTDRDLPSLTLTDGSLIVFPPSDDLVYGRLVGPALLVDALAYRQPQVVDDRLGVVARLRRAVVGRCLDHRRDPV